jgi:hypothetical protein
MQLKVLVGEAPSEMAPHGQVRFLCAISLPFPANNSEVLMDFDPRWTDDPRDDDRRDDVRREESRRELNQGSRGVSSDPLERDARDPRDVFTRDLDLPRGPDRERVWFREHSVLLRGSESRALATTGAFRVVHADDLRDSRGHSFNPRSGELRRLREQKLVRTIPIRDGRALVVLTERGRDVLERNRHEREQHFYSGLQRPRELLHDAKVYQAYEREAERLREDGAVIHRVMLDTELKREYQQFLQEHNRGKSDSDGRPDRSPDESRAGRWTTASQRKTVTSSSQTRASSTKTETAANTRATSRWRR